MTKLAEPWLLSKPRMADILNLYKDEKETIVRYEMQVNGFSREQAERIYDSMSARDRDYLYQYAKDNGY